MNKTKTTHARNHASADLDSYLVNVLEREGFEVISILSRRQTRKPGPSVLTVLNGEQVLTNL